MYYVSNFSLLCHTDASDVCVINITYLLTDVISRYWLKSALFRGGLVSLSANFRWHRPPTSVGIRKMIIISCGIKTSAVFSIVSSQSTRVTDRQTDRQNYDSKDRASIVASRGKNSCFFRSPVAVRLLISTKLYMQIEDASTIFALSLIHIWRCRRRG